MMTRVIGWWLRRKARQREEHEALRKAIIRQMIYEAPHGMGVPVLRGDGNDSEGCYQFQLQQWHDLLADCETTRADGRRIYYVGGPRYIDGDESQWAWCDPREMQSSVFRRWKKRRAARKRRTMQRVTTDPASPEDPQQDFPSQIYRNGL